MEEKANYSITRVYEDNSLVCIYKRDLTLSEALDVLLKDDFKPPRNIIGGKLEPRIPVGFGYA